jgi:predicted ATPase
LARAGLGKSRLIREIREHVRQTDPDAELIELRCSSQHQNSGLYPARDFFERLLGFQRDTPPKEKLDGLVAHLDDFGMPLQETVPLFAALLSVSLDARFTAPQLQPQKLKELTQRAILDWLSRFSSRQPVLFIVEDLHWVDPSTLELLGLLMGQGFQQSVLSVLTFRPDFTTPWRVLVTRRRWLSTG